MNRGLILAGMMVMALLGAVIVMADPARADVVQQNNTHDQARITAALRALMEGDESRLYRDGDYAEEMLGHFDVLEAAYDNPDLMLAVDALRVIALLSLERNEEIGPAIDRVMAWRPNDTVFYYNAWWAALVTNDYPRAVAAVEQASRVVRGAGWAELRADLGDVNPWMVLQVLRERNETALRVRFAEALFRIGWPGGGDIEGADALRKILLDDHLRQGDRTAAANVAGGVTAPDTILPLITLRRYDGLLDGDADPVARLQAAIDEYDRTTAGAIVRDVPHYRRLLDRAQFLALVNRNAEAWVLLEPYTANVAETVAADRDGMWLVNQAVYALASLGRETEAIELSRRLAEIPIEVSTHLIGPHINHASNLNAAGLHEEALTYARELEQASGHFANDYGRMLIWRAVVCALAAQGRSEEAADTMTQLLAADDANPMALIHSQMCLNDLDAAEARLVRFLESDDPGTAAIALQHYELDADGATTNGLVVRARDLRDRPAVRVALERVAHVRSLPLARGAWR